MCLPTRLNQKVGDFRVVSVIPLGNSIRVLMSNSSYVLQNVSRSNIGNLAPESTRLPYVNEIPKLSTAIDPTVCTWFPVTSLLFTDRNPRLDEPGDYPQFGSLMYDRQGKLHFCGMRFRGNAMLLKQECVAL